MTVAEYIADFIEEKKMDFVFQYPGGMITHMIDAIGTRDRLKFILYCMSNPLPLLFRP